MRGTDRLSRRLSCCHRITPARAGNRCRWEFIAVRMWDHPRACGEQWMLPRWASCWAGSPPRVRGTGIIRPARQRISRITPARAGNSRGKARAQAEHEDHPRACGEQNLATQYGGNITGSPPRVRGTVPNPAQGDHYNGITPARAGNRIYRHIWLRKAGDHPRACGEQCLPAQLA